MSYKKNLGLKILVLFMMVAFSGLGFSLRQEKPVTLDLDGQWQSYMTRELTVQGFLESQGVRYHQKDYITPELEEFLRPGEIIHVKISVPVEISVDGRLVQVEDFEDLPQKIVERAGITLGELDRVEGKVTKEALPVRLSVVRVVEMMSEEEETIPYKQERILDAQIKRGDSKLLQAGENGLIKKKILLHWENGVLVERQLVETIVLKSAKPKIMVYGTKEPVSLASRSLENPKKVLSMSATAYTHTGNTTYTGVYPRVGTIAVDPKVIPLGSHLWVEGYGYGMAEDTGGLIKGHNIDLFMETRQECRRWGVKEVTVYVLQ